MLAVLVLFGGDVCVLCVGISRRMGLVESRDVKRGIVTIMREEGGRNGIEVQCCM